MKVERFFHLRRGERGGATVRVVGDTDRPQQVEVQAAFCSPKDTYCKATGRELAASRTPKVIPLRGLPAELARCGKRADSISHGSSSLSFTNYSFSMGYFLPKELA